MTREQAWLIMDAHGIVLVLEDEEEREILLEQNPELLDAYQALFRYAQGIGTLVRVDIQEESDG